MPDPVGLLGLSLTCLAGCVKGLTVLGRAKHYTRDVTDLRLQVDLVLNSLFTWAKQAGLTDDPPSLLVNVDDAELVPKILGQLGALLLDLDRLKQRYGLYLQPTSENVEELDQDNPVAIQLGPQARRCTESAIVNIFRQKKEPWKRLRWVTMDDKKFEKLLGKVKDYIQDLEKFLEQARREQREKDQELCLRDAILNTDGHQELDMIGKECESIPSELSIAVAAKLKLTRLQLGFSETTASTSTILRPTGRKWSSSGTNIKIRDQVDIDSSSILQMRRLKLSRSAREQKYRTLAEYDGEAVLLEWKDVPSLDNPTIYKRVNQVAAFLKDLGPSVHSLPCKGFVKDQVSKRYGYIFTLPEPVPGPVQQNAVQKQDEPTLQSLELKSLRQLLETTSSPALNARLSLVLNLLEALLNLHTSGWLHKELRSSNIILLHNLHADKQVLGNRWPGSMYVAGYVSSRLDNPGEMTEPLESDLEANLYRHPSLLAENRKSFRKSFDLFSIGCTLLEIGLWSSLRSILESHTFLPTDLSLRPYKTTSRSSTQLRCDTCASSELSMLNDEKPNAHIDLMKRRYELLLLPLNDHHHNTTSSFGKPKDNMKMDRSEIMKTLEAAMGQRYTGLVEEFLAAASFIVGNNVDEEGYALELELRARDTIKALIKVL
jgi:hypothetical protein